MYLNEEIRTETYTRVSKLGVKHTYDRTRRVVVFRCDNCKEIFYRDRQNMSPKRLSNNYFHCCANCDPKKFAQKRCREAHHMGHAS